MPKKKGSKKGAKIIDGLATNEMSREQLMGHVKRIQMELEREREERNFFMLEREKLFSLWNMTLEQIAVEKDRARLMEVQVADSEKEKQDEMNMFKQKLRYLMMDQVKKLSQVRLHHLERMKRLQDETRKIEISKEETLVGTKRELISAKRSMHEFKHRLLLKHKLELTKIRMGYGNEIRQLESDFGRRFFLWQREARTDDRLMTIDLEKREQVEDILALHENQLEEMKSFYNDMMTNNFAIITALQNDLEESRSNEDKLLMEIKKLKEAVSKFKSRKSTQGENERVEGGVSGVKPNFVKDPVRSSLERILERKNRYCEVLECANESLLERALLAEKERDSLREACAKAVIEMQKKASMVKLVSNMKINSLSKKARRESHNGYNDMYHDEDTGGNRFEPGKTGTLNNLNSAPRRTSIVQQLAPTFRQVLNLSQPDNSQTFTHDEERKPDSSTCESSRTAGD